MCSSLGANHSQPPRRLKAALGLPVTKIPEAALKLVRSVEITANFQRCNKFLNKILQPSRYGGNGRCRRRASTTEGTKVHKGIPSWTFVPSVVEDLLRRSSRV